MAPISSLAKAHSLILQDAIRRDLTTARRDALLAILWDEGYLTRSQLIARVELRLGRGCFGASAWADTFFRDMRVVKQALAAAGQKLAYSRSERRPGYYLAGRLAISADLQAMLRSSAGEVDQRQIDIYSRLSPAERFHKGCSTSDIARNAVAYRIRQQDPSLSAAEANRRALQRAYQRG